MSPYCVDTQNPRLSSKDRKGSFGKLSLYFFKNPPSKSAITPSISTSTRSLRLLVLMLALHREWTQLLWTHLTILGTEIMTHTLKLDWGSLTREGCDCSRTGLVVLARLSMVLLIINAFVVVFCWVRGSHVYTVVACVELQRRWPLSLFAARIKRARYEWSACEIKPVTVKIIYLRSESSCGYLWLTLQSLPEIISKERDITHSWILSLTGTTSRWILWNKQSGSGS